MSDSEKCCFCFSLDTGVKIIGGLTILGALILIVQGLQVEEIWALWSPMIAASGVMALIWICVFINPTESGRKFALLGWLILIVGFLRIYYLTVILNGSALNRFCQTVSETQDSIGETHITREDCLYGGKNFMLFDCIGNWLLEIYFAYVIMRWSKFDEDYEKA